MPSDSNGVYSLPPGYLAVTGETILASQHNPPLEDIASALTQRVMRSGVTPFTGPQKNADGSASAPAMTFNSATRTGFYKTENGVGVAVNGTQVAEFGPGGITKGARFIGELITWTRVSPPPLCVLPYGQTLNRADYPDLWAVAQAEIAAGNTFYNNGNGSTTFGIGDLRGRVIAGIDNMGGSPAGRISLGSIGSVGGNQTHKLTGYEMPSHFHAANIYDPGHVHGGIPVPGGTGAGNPGVLAITIGASANTAPAGTGVRVNSPNGIDTTYSAGSDVAHNNLQPTMICNFALYAGA